MACPACGCKETYYYEEDEDGWPGESLERCAACGVIFDVDDHLPEDDEE